MVYPEYAEVNGKRYKINTDFRIAIECNEIAQDETIGDLERALGIIYKLYGEEGLNDANNYEKLIEIGMNYLMCGEKPKKTNEKPDMDYVQDEKYIRSSFKYDYQEDPYSKDYVHWYEFFNDLNNLSDDEFGTCCVLSRVRNLRRLDLRTIKDSKEREKLKKAKEQVALKKHKQDIKLTDEQKKNQEDILKKVGLI